MAEWIATQKRCDDCANSRTIVSEYGFFSICCFLQKKAMDCFIGKKNYFVSRTPKERGADKQKITCLNCKHLMFSDMYGECDKQLRIVNPSDTCEYAEPKERGGEK